MEVEILACPFCGWNHSRRQSRKRLEKGGRDLADNENAGFSFSNIDPARVLVFQRRSMTGAGRSSRNARIETIEALHLWELPDDLKDEIRNQAKRVLELTTPQP